MKSSNPQVMVQAYRLLVKTMLEEFGECYPLHLGVTEAGDGEDGRIKSAALVSEHCWKMGLGDTIRVSLTEDPEFEIPVCKDLVKRYALSNCQNTGKQESDVPAIDKLNYDPFTYKRRPPLQSIILAENMCLLWLPTLVRKKKSHLQLLKGIGYSYDAATDKWNIGDAAADYLYTDNTC